MPSVFLQGEFLSGHEARVSAFDAGLQHAVGVFDTMLAVVAPAPAPLNSELEAAHADEAEVASRTRVVDGGAHCARLLTSCIELGLTSALRVGPLHEAIMRTVAREHIARSAQLSQLSRQSQAVMPTTPTAYRVRCTITGGDLNLLRKPSDATGASQPERRQDPTVLVVAQPATHYPDEMFEKGVPAVLARLRISPLDETASHKTLNYWARLRELQRAHARGASEAIVLDVTNHVVGGCVSSIVLVKNNTLLLPPARGELLEDDTAPQQAQREAQQQAQQELSLALRAAGLEDDAKAASRSARPALTNEGLPSCVLPGITREFVLHIADDELMDVQLRPLTMRDVLEADEVLLTNSSWGVLPVIAVESTPIGKAAPMRGGAIKPGPIARLLRSAWRQHTLGVGE
jgi:branched-subunit amino acid aminotransferase/4-amino-4-deoxychorismate lyase